MKAITVRGDDVVLDAVLAKEFGPVVGRSMVAATLVLNPGLASLGPVLPIGTAIIIPDAPSATKPQRAVVSLFG